MCTSVSPVVSYRLTVTTSRLFKVSKDGSQSGKQENAKTCYQFQTFCSPNFHSTPCQIDSAVMQISRSEQQNSYYNIIVSSSVQVEKDDLQIK